MARVVKHVGFGALCVVGRDIPAILRHREVSWDPELQSTKRLPEGTNFHAVVIHYDDEWRQFELSLKAVEPEPFEEFTKSHKVGQLVEASIAELTPRTAIVRLEGGLEAEVSFDTLPNYQMEHPEMSVRWELAIGDWLLLEIDDFKQKEKKILLNFGKAIEKKRKEWSEWLATIRTSDTYAEGVSTLKSFLPDKASSKNLGSKKSSGRLNILVVDNEEHIAIPLGSILTDRAHHVEIAMSNDLATAKIRQLKKLDVAIVDLQLSGESGAILLTQIKKQFPQARIVVYTGNLPSLREASFPQGTIPLLKPLDTEELIEVLEGRHIPATPTRGWEIDEQVTTIAQNSDRVTKFLGHSTLQVIDDYLASMIEPFCSVGLAILSQSKVMKDVVCLRSIGLPKGLFDHTQRNLKYSFFGNVLDGRDSGFHCSKIVEYSDEKSDAFDILLSETRFDAVYAIPLELEIDNTSLAVFLFFEQTQEGLPIDAIRHLHHQTTALSLALARGIWDAELARNQRSLSAGAFMLGMAHELRNSITAMKLTVDSTLSARYFVESKKTLEQTTTRNLDNLKIQLDQLSKSMESLLGLSRIRSTGYKPVGSFIADIIKQCQPIAEGSDIAIVFESCNASPEIFSEYISDSAFQVILNVVLNSIQHVRAFRTENGFVHISVSAEKIDNKPSIDIYVKDNAFGINWKQKEQLFGMFHTTRRDGSGLGLYISRIIIESLGGDIKFVSSYKFIGTTLRVRIPIVEVEQ